MPQNKEAHRKVARESARRKRGQHPGSTNEGVNTIILAGVNIPKGVTFYHYFDGQRVTLEALPEGCKALSDGQVWSPQEILPVVIKDPVRRERARRYWLWRAGRPVDDLDPGMAARLLLICTSLNKHDVAHMVRYGVNGPTMDVVSERLGAS